MEIYGDLCQLHSRPLICMVASSIGNNGTIQCDADDSISIFCNRFKNTGTILPNPDIIINQNSQSILVDQLLSALCRRSTPIDDAANFYQNVGVTWNPELIPYILSHEVLCEETDHQRQSLCKRLGMELDIHIFHVKSLLHENAAFDGDLIAPLLVGKMQNMSVRTVFGNEAGSEVIECDVDPKYLSRCIPLNDCQSDLFGMTVFVKPENGTDHVIKLGRFWADVYVLQSTTPLIVDQPFNNPVFDEQTGVGGPVSIECSSDIDITEGGGINAVLTDSVNSARLRRMNGVINVVSNGNITINGPLISMTADTLSNHGTVQREDDTGCIVINCTKFVNTGLIEPAPDITIKLDTMHKVQGAATWSKSEKKVRMKVHDDRGLHLSFYPKNMLIDDGDSEYESNGNVNRESDWIIYKLLDIVKLSRITIPAGDNNKNMEAVVLWMSGDDGKWFKICNDINGIQQQKDTPLEFNLSLIVSDEQLLAEKVDFLMLEIVNNHNDEKQNAVAALELFGYPLSEEIKSE